MNNNKKELSPIYNKDIKGHKEYIFEQLEKYKSGDLNFTHKRINNKMIEEYTKYFVYKDNTFMAVKPSESGYPSGYYEHIKQYNYRVDHINKIILFTDTEVEEEPKKETKEEFYNNNEVEPATEEAEESQEQPQNGYTEEDYNRYLEYKEGLIQEYGEEIYNLMNQEAGIETEEDSFNHFMEYGI